MPIPFGSNPEYQRPVPIPRYKPPPRPKTYSAPRPSSSDLISPMGRPGYTPSRSAYRARVVPPTYLPPQPHTYYKSPSQTYGLHQDDAAQQHIAELMKLGASDQEISTAWDGAIKKKYSWIENVQEHQARKRSTQYERLTNKAIGDVQHPPTLTDLVTRMQKDKPMYNLMPDVSQSTLRKDEAFKPVLPGTNATMGQFARMLKKTSPDQRGYLGNTFDTMMYYGPAEHEALKGSRDYTHSLADRFKTAQEKQEIWTKAHGQNYGDGSSSSSGGTTGGSSNLYGHQIKSKEEGVDASKSHIGDVFAGIGNFVKGVDSKVLGTIGGVASYYYSPLGETHNALVDSLGLTGAENSVYRAAGHVADNQGGWALQQFIDKASRPLYGVAGGFQGIADMGQGEKQTKLGNLAAYGFGLAPGLLGLDVNASVKGVMHHPSRIFDINRGAIRGVGRGGLGIQKEPVDFMRVMANQAKMNPATTFQDDPRVQITIGTAYDIIGDPTTYGGGFGVGSRTALAVGKAEEAAHYAEVDRLAEAVSTSVKEAKAGGAKIKGKNWEPHHVKDMITGGFDEIPKDHEAHAEMVRRQAHTVPALQKALARVSQYTGSHTSATLEAINKDLETATAKQRQISEEFGKHVAATTTKTEIAKAVDAGTLPPESAQKMVDILDSASVRRDMGQLGSRQYGHWAANQAAKGNKKAGVYWHAADVRRRLGLSEGSSWDEVRAAMTEHPEVAKELPDIDKLERAVETQHNFGRARDLLPPELRAHFTADEVDQLIHRNRQLLQGGNYGDASKAYKEGRNAAENLKRAIAAEEDEHVAAGLNTSRKANERTAYQAEASSLIRLMKDELARKAGKTVYTDPERAEAIQNALDMASRRAGKGHGVEGLPDIGFDPNEMQASKGARSVKELHRDDLDEVDVPKEHAEEKGPENLFGSHDPEELLHKYVEHGERELQKLNTMNEAGTFIKGVTPLNDVVLAGEHLPNPDFANPDVIKNHLHVNTKGFVDIVNTEHLGSEEMDFLEKLKASVDNERELKFKEKLGRASRLKSDEVRKTVIERMASKKQKFVDRLYEPWQNRAEADPDHPFAPKIFLKVKGKKIFSGSNDANALVEPHYTKRAEDATKILDILRYGEKSELDALFPHEHTPNVTEESLHGKMIPTTSKGGVTKFKAKPQADWVKTAKAVKGKKVATSNLNALLKSIGSKATVESNTADEIAAEFGMYQREHAKGLTKAAASETTTGPPTWQAHLRRLVEENGGQAPKSNSFADWRRYVTGDFKRSERADEVTEQTVKDAQRKPGKMTPKPKAKDMEGLREEHYGVVNKLFTRHHGTGNAPGLEEVQEALKSVKGEKFNGWAGKKYVKDVHGQISRMMHDAGNPDFVDLEAAAEHGANAKSWEAMLKKGTPNDVIYQRLKKQASAKDIAFNNEYKKAHGEWPYQTREEIFSAQGNSVVSRTIGSGRYARKGPSRFAKRYPHGIDRKEFDRLMATPEGIEMAMHDSTLTFANTKSPLLNYWTASNKAGFNPVRWAVEQHNKLWTMPEARRQEIMDTIWANATDRKRVKHIVTTPEKDRRAVMAEHGLDEATVKKEVEAEYGPDIKKSRKFTDVERESEGKAAMDRVLDALQAKKLMQGDFHESIGHEHLPNYKEAQEALAEVHATEREAIPAQVDEEIAHDPKLIRNAKDRKKRIDIKVARLQEAQQAERTAIKIGHQQGKIAAKLHHDQVLEEVKFRRVQAAITEQKGLNVHFPGGSSTFIPTPAAMQHAMDAASGMPLIKHTREIYAKAFMQPTKGMPSGLQAARAIRTGQTSDIIKGQVQEINDLFKGMPLEERKRHLNALRTGVGMDDTTRKIGEAFNKFLPYYTRSIRMPGEHGAVISPADVNAQMAEPYRVSLKGGDDFQSMREVLNAMGVIDHKTGEVFANEDPFDVMHNLAVGTSNAHAKAAMIHTVNEGFGLKREGKIGPIGRGKDKKWGFKPNRTELSQSIEAMGDADTGWVTIPKFGDTHYFHPEVAKMIHRLNDMFDPLESGKLSDVIDTATGLWKASATVYNPGFYTRNGLGEIMATWMAGHQNPKDYGRSTKLLRYANREGATNKARGEFMPARSEADEGVKGSQHFMTKRDGERVSYEQMHRMLDEHGLNTGYVDTELKSSLRAQRRRERPVLGGPSRFHEKARKVGEDYENYLRWAHFIAAVRKSNKPLAQAARDAAEEVRYWHFDYTDFTPFERQYALRTHPFMKWVRRAIPLYMGMMFVKPGKMMVYPKVMNAASDLLTRQDIGQDDNGFFPNYHGVVPSWMQDLMAWQISGNTDDTETGGTGSFMNVNVPQWDAIKQGMNPIGTFNQMLSPLIKIPAEEVMGHTSGPDLGGGFEVDLNDPKDGHINRLNHIMGVVPAARFAGRAALKGNGLDWDQVISFGTGAGVYENTPARQYGELQNRKQQ